MSTSTSNYNIVKPDLNETADIEVINQNMDMIDTELKSVNNKADGKISKSLATAASQFLVSTAVGQWAIKTIAEVKTLLGLKGAAEKDFDTAGGVAAYDTVNSHLSESAVLIPKTGSTANSILLDIVLADKKKGSFLATSTNTGNMTINGKVFKKDTSKQIAVGGVKTGRVYDFYYDLASDSVFILAKASGTAIASDVLATETFSNDDGEQTGTMPNYAGTAQSPISIESPGGGLIYVHPKSGYYDAVGNITLYDPNLIAPYIVSGKSILGVVGAFNGRQLQIMHNVMTSSPLTFYLLDGTPRDKACIQVTGLIATPTIIVVNSEDNGLEMVTYNAYASQLNGYYALLVNNWWYRVDGQCYVNNTGFRLPISDENVSRCTVTIVY